MQFFSMDTPEAKINTIFSFIIIIPVILFYARIFFVFKSKLISGKNKINFIKMPERQMTKI